MKPIKHYKNRSLKDINGEVWFPCIFYEKNFFYNFGSVYSVSSFGRVKSKHKNIILKPSVLPNGYLRVCLYDDIKKEILVHRLLLLCAGVPNPNNKKQVNHITGFKYDNRLEKLEWATHKENGVHAASLGLLNSMKGVVKGKKGRCLVDKEVLHIATSKANVYDIAVSYGISRTTVVAIRNGQNWSWLTGIKQNN